MKDTVNKGLGLLGNFRGTLHPLSRDETLSSFCSVTREGKLSLDFIRQNMGFITLYISRVRTTGSRPASPSSLPGADGEEGKTVLRVEGKSAQEETEVREG